MTDLAGHVRGVNQALVEVYQSIETLGDQRRGRREHVAELAASVRETVSSIEEMAYSIREVARTSTPSRSRPRRRAPR
jgi:methyl-accepting chemotaxis protein